MERNYNNPDLNNLNIISSNREKLDYLQNYYKNKTAIIVGTGPEYKNQIDSIKTILDENVILICMKQSIKDFDMICDFHVYNGDHFENYKYTKNCKPIVLYLNYSRPNTKNWRRTLPIADINLFKRSFHGTNHIRKNIITELNNNQETNLFGWNDDNLGVGENVCVHAYHVMFEQGLPLAVNLGCNRIITNGWVGGFSHGTKLIRENVINDSDISLESFERVQIDKYLTTYLKDNYHIKLFTLGYSLYTVPNLTICEFIRFFN